MYCLPDPFRFLASNNKGKKKLLVRLWQILIWLICPVIKANVHWCDGLPGLSNIFQLDKLPDQHQKLVQEFRHQKRKSVCLFIYWFIRFLTHCFKIIPIQGEKKEITGNTAGVIYKKYRRKRGSLRIMPSLLSEAQSHIGSYEHLNHLLR